MDNNEIVFKDYTIPKDRTYAETHEWLKLIENRRARVGISDYAQKKLKSIVYVDTPEIGREVPKGEVITTVESVKAVGEVIAPVDCKITAFNKTLEDDPSILNSDPYEQGWIVEIEVKNPADLENLLTAEQYVEVIKKEEGD